MATTLFVHTKRKPASVEKIIAAFASRGFEVTAANIRVLVWRSGLPNAGMPRKIAFVDVDAERTVEALALTQIAYADEVYFLSTPQRKTPPSILGQQQETKIVPKGQRTKSFDESDFRG